jgi:site-specific DNA-cytosine methylase
MEPILLKEPLTFIDLFCGIGGFHQALKKLGAKCILACDINKDCREVYLDNYGITEDREKSKLTFNNAKKLFKPLIKKNGKIFNNILKEQLEYLKKK